jgi:L-iditol 2-dehydrogenase
MKVALLYGPHDLRICQTDKPKPTSKEEALIKIQSCGICSTDLRFFEGTRKPTTYPITLGHEIVGETVNESQRGSQKLMVALGRVSCGQCEYCRMGLSNLCVHSSFVASGFGEYAIYSKSNLVQVPEFLSANIACLAEPIGCCINGLQKLFLNEKSEVMIIGDGSICMIFTQLLNLSGVKHIHVIGHHNERLELCHKFGATSTTNTKNVELDDVISNPSLRNAFDVVIVAAGNPTAYFDGLHMLSKRGRLLAFSSIYPEERIPLDFDDLRRSEYSIVGSYECTKEHVKSALALMKKGDIQLKPIITHVYELDEMENAFSLILQRRAIKVVINP